MGEREFNTEEPLAYFLTWTTYGTWLPGDERGWKRRDCPDIQLANPFLLGAAEAQMKEAVFDLSPTDRQVIKEVIGKHCEIRGWHLHAVNPRTNHVHVVVTAHGYDPVTVRDQFKAWGTRKLKAINQGRKRFWTEGGSCRYINQEDDLSAAIRYVLDAQDPIGVEAE